MDAINVDYNKNLNPDKLWNLNNFPYPFGDGSFNTIFLLDTLEHLKYPEKTIKECFRILKKNGKLIVAVPSERSKYFRHENHINFFHKKDLKGILTPFETNIFGYRGNSKEISAQLGKLLGKFAGNEWVCVCCKI
jgi:ubiquinone/menaquinone biosynthesis C-methylase UbiE